MFRAQPLEIAKGVLPNPDIAGLKVYFLLAFPTASPKIRLMTGSTARR